MKRDDGRDSFQLRPPKIEIGVIEDPEVGSSQVSFGHTAVIASVRGPYETANPKRCFLDSAAIRVIVENDESSSDAAHRADSALEQQVQGFLMSIASLEAFPLQAVDVTLIVLNDEGSLASVAMNAAVSAWMHAGLPLKLTSLAVTLGLDAEGRLLADPLSSEKASCSYIATLALRASDYGVIGVWPEAGSGTTLAEAEGIALLAENCVSLLGVLLRETLGAHLSELRAVAATNNE